MSTQTEIQCQMFEEIKGTLEHINRRLDRIERQIFEDEESSFRVELKKYVVGMEYSYKEFRKAQTEILQSLKAMQKGQN